MIRWVRWFGVGFAAALGGLIVVAIVARFADGPIGPFRGGPLRTGELVSQGDVDWSFAKSVQEVELELVEPARSRTTWILVLDGKPYIPCGFLHIPFWKQWPYEALIDGRAVVRISGKRYERQAVQVTDPELRARLGARVAEKYGVGGSGPPDPERVWFFRLDLRPRT